VFSYQVLSGSLTMSGMLTVELNSTVSGLTCQTLLTGTLLSVGG